MMRCPTTRPSCSSRSRSRCTPCCAHPPEGAGSCSLVIGSGTIALATIWALRATGFEGPILAQAKREHEQELARTLGASDVVAPGFEGERRVDRHWCVRLYAGGGPRGLFGRWLSPHLRLCRQPEQPRTVTRFRLTAGPHRGHRMCVAEFKKLDLTFVWARELRIRGAVGYGQETWRGERRHTFEIAHDPLARDGCAGPGHGHPRVSTRPVSGRVACCCEPPEERRGEGRAAALRPFTLQSTICAAYQGVKRGSRSRSGQRFAATVLWRRTVLRGTVDSSPLPPAKKGALQRQLQTPQDEPGFATEIRPRPHPRW